MAYFYSYPLYKLCMQQKDADTVFGMIAALIVINLLKTKI